MKKLSTQMFCFLAACVSALKPPIIPYPNEVIFGDGNWTLSSKACIGYDGDMIDALNIASMVSDQLRIVTGYDLPLTDSSITSGIYFGPSESVSGDEEYIVTMGPKVVNIFGNTAKALFYGFQTLLQILPNEILKNELIVSVNWTAPILTVHDSPRFQWRGLMIDTVRHFQTVDSIKKMITGMARYKLNTLHLHLTDDQGWRIESKRFPNLTEIGAVRKSSPKHWDRNELDGIQYGPFFYTQEEIKDIIQFAKERMITVVPEIEMPGHAVAALSAFPHLSCTGGPFQPRCLWGVDNDVYCAGNDDTIEFLEQILDEMMELFDSEYIHIGGDECPKTRWQSCSRCQARMEAQGITSYDSLQSWFTAHFANYLHVKGRKLIGWDEICQGGLPDSTTVMVWRDAASASTAAKLGHNVIMTLTSAMYFDYPQFTGTDSYEYISSSTSSLHKVYMHDPAASIDEEYKHYVIGVQGNLWGEYIWELDDLEYKAFPRMAALAEISWTQLENKDWARFLTNVVRVEMPRLNILNVNCAPIALGLKAKWEPGELPYTDWVNMNWPVTGAINDAGTYGIAFIWKGGANALKIKNVQIWVAGLPGGTDSHEGYAFEESQDNIYTVKTYIPATVTKVTISADVCCDGGSDSKGEILIYYH